MVPERRKKVPLVVFSVVVLFSIRRGACSRREDQKGKLLVGETPGGVCLLLVLVQRLGKKSTPETGYRC